MGLSHEDRHTAQSSRMVQTFAPAMSAMRSFFTSALIYSILVNPHLAPMTQQEEAEEHSAQMCAMSYSVSRLSQS